MDSILCIVDDVKFDIEIALEQQLGSLPLPFPGMDKSAAAVCEFFAKSTCINGANCPYRHVRSDRTIVCKHWLRGLCKKGDSCEFLHEYDMSKMPECYFYSRFNSCNNKECPFLHIDPESKIKDCPWYDRGFCRHGPNCRHRHVRRVMCINYLAGFCPDGPNCKFMHPRFDLPVLTEDKMQTKRGVVTCHWCGEQGHKALHCTKVVFESAEAKKLEGSQGQDGTVQNDEGNITTPRPFKYQLKPLGEVTCYKCGTQGHYANKCPKGHLAFLSKGAG